MRPIYLQMAGLQSYREVQEIDFTALCDAGVFGIFGPTGSGKSTILDAMTLALFGKVERAANGTQGIMNHAEQALSVSFTFELGHASGAQRYRVDRQFKRGGEVSVNNTVSRLIRYQDGETVVLADKAGEVNQQVQDILGLSMQDFTRAVVLPQGKFAEFLALKGSERRQMLQRLFHLEPYGDQLSAKTAARYKETDIAIKEITAEQQGLGDASQPALDAAAAALEAAAQAAQRLREQLAACEARAAEQRRVRELQQELAAVRVQREQHAARAPHVLALQAQLARAAQAELAQPYARQREQALARLARERDAAAAAEAALQSAQAALEQAQAAHAAAREALAAQEAPLLLQLDKLQQAQALAAELKQQREALARLAAQDSQTEAALAEAREQLLREQELRDKAVKRQADLKAELALVEVPSGIRERLQEALQEKRTIEQWRQQLEDQRAERERHEAGLQAIGQEQAELQSKESQWGQDLSAWLQDMSEIYSAVSGHEDSLTGITEAIPGWIGDFKAAGREAELKAMAAALAAKLESGDPCPVCGSTHHPAPNSLHEHEAETGSDTEAAIARLENLLLQARQQQLAASQLSLSLNHVVQQWRSMLPQLQANETLAEAAAAIEAWELRSERERSCTVVDRSAAEQQLKEDFQQAENGLTEANKQYQLLQKRLQELLQLRGSLDRMSGELRSKQQTLHTLAAGVRQKTEKLQQTVSELTDSWKRKFSDIDYEQVEAAAERQRKSLQQAEDIRQRLDKSVGFIDEKLLAISGIQQRMNELDRQSVQWKTEWKSVHQQVEEKAAKLTEWAGSGDIQSQMEAASKQLDGLRLANDRTKLEHESSQLAGQQAAQAYAAACKAVQNAAEQAEQAEEEWKRQAALHSFASPEEVISALISDDNKQAWSAEVEAYSKLEHQLRTQEAQLAGQLAGRSITEEQWAAMESELAECKRLDEAALQAKAKAERDWESIQAKHARWSELESRRLVKQSELTLLSKLQSVLRGNAFVEFLAEEQLMQVSRAASERLGQLTRQKYAIEVDSSGGFIIRDDSNGGVKRPVSTLSGGETFLTSLSLALALSAQIQLKGQYPLEFFFLDEGFGTLDQDLLETVIVALEKLHYDKLTVGVISHVPELRARLPRRLVVQPAEPGGKGSSVYLETL